MFRGKFKRKTKRFPVTNEGIIKKLLNKTPIPVGVFWEHSHVTQEFSGLPDKPLGMEC